jgi:hypothetical protein
MTEAAFHEFPLSQLFAAHQTVSDRGDCSKQCCPDSRTDDNFDQNMGEQVIL